MSHNFTLPCSNHKESCRGGVRSGVSTLYECFNKNLQNVALVPHLLSCVKRKCVNNSTDPDTCLFINVQNSGQHNILSSVPTLHCCIMVFLRGAQRNNRTLKKKHLTLSKTKFNYVVSISIHFPLEESLSRVAGVSYF